MWHAEHLVFRHSIAEYLIVSDSVFLSSYCISTVALNGAYVSTFNLFHYSNMILRAISAPVKEDDISRSRGVGSFLPLAFALEPVNATRHI